MNKDKIIIGSSLESLLEKKKFNAIKEILETLNPQDIALIFKDISDDKIPLLFRLLTKDNAAEVFVEMESDDQEILIKHFSDNELKEIVDELFVDDVVDIIDEMPANVVKRILNSSTPEMRRDINEILKYPENSAGSIMTTEYVSLKPDMTIDEAIDVIRTTGVDKETIYTSYVTKDKKIVGIVEAKDLLLEKNRKAKIKDIMDTNIVTVKTLDDQETVASVLSKYDLIAVPVVDSEDRMIGIITFDDAMDVMEDEVSEDIAIMGGMSPNEKPYTKSSVFEIYKHRIPWLMLLMISATFTGLIITHFESALATQVVLTAFIPMLMDTGGNTGSQASVTIIRSLSLGEITFKDLASVVWKEIRVAVLCGLSLSVICFAKIMIVDKFLLGNDSVTALIALVVCISLAITVLVAKTIGCTLPMVAKKFGFDPAVMASPFITTIVDAISLLVYFAIATSLLTI